MSDNQKECFKLNNKVQNYDWGDTSFIPDLLGIENKENLPYAELWMGAHPKASSELEDGTPLIDYISSNTNKVLGNSIAAEFGNLPYLFKVLSAGSPLSIQVHPDKNRAEEGFYSENKKGIALDAFNRNYKDDNHKPEIICALTPFWAMKGFRSAHAIYELILLSTSPILKDLGAVLVDSSLSEWDQLKGFFVALMNLQNKKTKKLISELSSFAVHSDHTVFKWIARLLEFYPGDIGALAPLYLNLIHLKPGEALYLGAGVLHAYLEGTGMELMANSDNVLRGGLTAKFMDPKELIEVVLFDSDDPEILHPVHNGDEWIYNTPSREFQLSRISVETHAVLGGPVTPSILICVEGFCEIDGKIIKRGETLFIPSSKRAIDVKGNGVLYRAGLPL